MHLHVFYSFVVFVICMCSSIVFQWVSSLLLPNGCNVIRSLILCVISLLPGATWNTTGKVEPVCLMCEGDSCVLLFPFCCLTAVFYLLTTGNAWNITASEYCISTSSSDTVTEVLCVAVFSFLPPQWVSHTLYDMPQWCVHCQ